MKQKKYERLRCRVQWKISETGGGKRKTKSSLWEKDRICYSIETIRFFIPKIWDINFVKFYVLFLGQSVSKNWKKEAPVVRKFHFTNDRMSKFLPFSNRYFFRKFLELKLYRNKNTILYNTKDASRFNRVVRFR